MFKLLSTTLLTTTANANLVGPGGMVPYGSGGGGRRVRYGVVRDASKGFFLGGSAIEEMNGIYHRVEGLPKKCKHTGIYYKDGTLTYRSDSTGWFMALIDDTPVELSEGRGEDQMGDDGQKRKLASKTKWVIMDNNMNDRFFHEGDTILPGSGTSWKHNLEYMDKVRMEKLRRQNARGAAGAGNDGEDAADDGGSGGGGIFDNLFGSSDSSESGSKDNSKSSNPLANEEDSFVDYDELPWQVIAIMDPEMLGKLMRYKRYHDHTVRIAISGQDLPALPPGSNNNGYNQQDEINGFVSNDINIPKEISRWCRFEFSETHRVLIDEPPSVNKTSEAAGAGAAGAAAAAATVPSSPLIDIAEFFKVFKKEVDEIITSGSGSSSSYNEAAELINEKMISNEIDSKVRDSLATQKIQFGTPEWASMLWIKGMMLKSMSFLYRRARNLSKAEETLTRLQVLFPSWKEGIMEKSMLLLDLGGSDNYGRAKHSLEQLLKIDREGQDLSTWLVFHQVVDKRHFSAASDYPSKKFGGMIDGDKGSKSDDESAKGGANPKKIIDPMKYLRDHSNIYSLLGVPIDIQLPKEEDLLRKSFRSISRLSHPDRNGKDFEELFSKIAKAYEVLGDVSKRRDYDEGVDLNDLRTQHHVEDEEGQGPPPSIKEETEKQYFPERYGFHPFGDPFERKRDQGHGDGYFGYKKKVGRAPDEKNPRHRYKTFGVGKGEDGMGTGNPEGSSDSAGSESGSDSGSSESLAKRKAAEQQFQEEQDRLRRQEEEEEDNGGYDQGYGDDDEEGGYGGGEGGGMEDYINDILNQEL